MSYIWNPSLVCVRVNRIPSCRKRLQDDLKSFGNRPSDKQSLELFSRRSALSTRIIRHRNDASLFIDVLLHNQSGGSLAEETDGQPELAPLFLPSHLTQSLMSTQRSQHVCQLERQLRRVACLRGLQRVRTTSLQKAQLIISKNTNARGEVANTRAQSMITRLTSRVNMAVWEYEQSRKALVALNASEEDIQLFHPLTPGDLSVLSSILAGKRQLGEGKKKLPWFWNLRSAGDGTTEVDSTDELNEGLE